MEYSSGYGYVGVQCSPIEGILVELLDDFDRELEVLGDFRDRQPVGGKFSDLLCPLSAGVGELVLVGEDPSRWYSIPWEAAQSSTSFFGNTTRLGPSCMCGRLRLVFHT